MRMLLTLLLLSTSTSAFAYRQTCNVNFVGRERYFETSGRWASKINIDQALQGNSDCRGLDMRNSQVQRVVLFALSENGQGQAYLASSDRQVSSTQNIYGDPNRYRNETGFEQVSLLNDSQSYAGSYAVYFLGSIVVDRMSVEVETQGGGNYPPNPPPPPYDPRPPYDPNPPYNPPYNPPHHGGERVLMGSFETGNPFNWDNDGINFDRGGRGDRFDGLEFRLDRGVPVEIRDVQVTCGRGPCDSVDVNQTVDEGRSITVRFRRPLNVTAITVRSKPRGFSIPPPRVEVYLFR